jgi:hypothetical protein
MAVFPLLKYSSWDYGIEKDTSVETHYDGKETGVANSTATKHHWKLELELSKTDMDSLWTFILARGGPGEKFYFYDLENNGFLHDPTGELTTGRFLVRFKQESFRRERIAENHYRISLEISEDF